MVWCHTYVVILRMTNEIKKCVYIMYYTNALPPRLFVHLMYRFGFCVLTPEDPISMSEMTYPCVFET